MKPNPLVSVALCTYNGEKHLREQVESILAQTYKNIELVIVDDCSTDGTLDIIRAFATGDERIRYFTNPRNLGFNKNFQKALELTSGEFIAISDQDDVWEQIKIEVLLDSIGDNWLVFSDSVRILDDGALAGGTLLGDFTFGPWGFRAALIENFITGHTCLMARAFLSYILPFPDTGYYDWWMGFVALYHQKLAFANRLLTRYRIHERSVTQIDIRKDKRVFQKIEFNNTLTMLANIADYRLLKELDKKMIIRLKNALANKLHTSVNPTLVALISRHYEAIFPRLKKRKGFSKINFAVKYSRKL